MKNFPYFIISTFTIFLSLQAYADPNLVSKEYTIDPQTKLFHKKIVTDTSFHEYQENLTENVNYIMDVIDKKNKFETEKRLLSTQENYDLACHLRDFSEKSLKYMNQYPQYKKQLYNYFETIQNFNTSFQNTIKKYNISCSNGYVPPPFSPESKWKEIPSNDDFSITYVDTDWHMNSLLIPDADVVKIRSVIKQNPDLYLDGDYLIFCKTKEYAITKIQKSTDPINSEDAEPKLPIEKHPMDELSKRIFDYQCK